MVNALAAPARPTTYDRFSGPTLSTGLSVKSPFERARLNDDWEQVAVKRLNELCALPSGWDGYSGKPVAFSSAQFALWLMHELRFESLPLPVISPTADGSITLEWESDRGTVELQVNGPQYVDVFVELPEHEVCAEMVARTNFQPLSNWLRVIF